MGPWDSKLRWQPGGNFQPARLVCEFNWRECPYEIGKYFWTEIYTDVAEFLSNKNEDLLLKGAFLFVISIIIYSIIYWKIRKTKEEKKNSSILNKIAFNIQDLELRVDILSYKLQHGRWPSLQQIANIHEIEEIKKNQVRLSVSATDNSKYNENLWLKQFFKNNFLKIKSSCSLFGKFPSEDCDSRQFKDSKTLPKISGNINFDGQNDDESVKEMQIMGNNFSHSTDDKENELEKVNVSDEAKEDTNTKALNKNNKNKEEIQNKNEKLLGAHKSQENIKNACEIKENGEFICNDNDKTRIVGEEELNYFRKDKNMLNNLNSSVKLNETLQIVEENSAAFSASESVVSELEKHSLNNSKVFFQPEIIFNSPSLNNPPTIDSAFKSTKPRREKAPKKSLEDVKKRLENLHCILQTYENQQELNSTELNKEKVTKKLLAQTFIQELSDFSIISESETDDKSSISYERKYSRVVNAIHQLDKDENYVNFSVEDDSESCKSNQSKKQEIAEEAIKDKTITSDDASKENQCNSLALEQQLMETHTENSIKSNENLMRIDEPLIELREDKSSGDERKFNESYKFFINSRSLYQSTLSDIISESDHIEETDGSGDYDIPNIIFEDKKIDFYHEDDSSLEPNNIWEQMVIDSDAKSVENDQETVENGKKDIEQLIDILDSDSFSDKEVSELFIAVSDHHTNQAQNDSNQTSSCKSLEDILINFENSDIFRNDLIDLNDDRAEKNKNKLNNLNTKISEEKNINKNSISNNGVEMTRKNYLISDKTFIKENIKKPFENNFEDKSLIELHSINFLNEHRISHDQCEVNIMDDIGKTLNDIKSDDNLNSIDVLQKDNSNELKEKIIFNEKNDTENSEMILNKLLITNDCENLSEIEFDVELEIQEHCKSECEKNPSINTLSERSSLYLTGEGSFSDISNNEKITDLIKLNNNNKENKINSEYNRNEEWKNQKKKENDEETITIASKDSAFYETPQSSVITVNNINAENNKNLSINISHDNCDQYSYDKKAPQIKLKSPKKQSKLEKGKCERATVKTERSSNVFTSREPTKLSDEKMNRFPTHLNIKLNNPLTKDMKGSKQKPTEEHERNSNLYKSQSTTRNNTKPILKNSKTNKLSLKAKNNSNLPNDFGQDLKKRGLEERSKSYITPRKLEFTPRSIINRLPNKKHQRRHSLVDGILEKNSESSKVGSYERKSSMNSKLDLDSKFKSRESINKSWKSNIPILKSRIELSKNKNITNHSNKNVSVQESSQLGDTENMLSCLKNNKNVQSHQNNSSSKNCIGLCRKFNQAFAKCKKVYVQEKSLLTKDLETEENGEGALLLQEAQRVISVNIIMNQEDTKTKLIDLKKFLRNMKDQELNNQNICNNNNDLDYEMECNCSKLLALISTLRQENQIVLCEQKEVEVLVKPPVVDTSTSISDLTQFISRNFVPGDNGIIAHNFVKFKGDSDQPNNLYNFQEFRSCEEIIQQIQKMEYANNLDICRMS